MITASVMSGAHAMRTPARKPRARVVVTTSASNGPGESAAPRPSPSPRITNCTDASLGTTLEQRRAGAHDAEAKDRPSRRRNASHATPTTRKPRRAYQCSGQSSVRAESTAWVQPCSYAAATPTAMSASA